MTRAINHLLSCLWESGEDPGHTDRTEGTLTTSHLHFWRSDWKTSCTSFPLKRQPHKFNIVSLVLICDCKDFCAPSILSSLAWVQKKSDQSVPATMTLPWPFCSRSWCSPSLKHCKLKKALSSIRVILGGWFNHTIRRVMHILFLSASGKRKMLALWEDESTLHWLLLWHHCEDYHFCSGDGWWEYKMLV